MRPSSIVIIDNDVDILGLISMILEQDGHGLVMLQEADFATIKSINPQLVILDISPNNCCNKEFYNHLRDDAATKAVPVILTSTLNGLEQVAADWKADSFICKPFDIDELTAKVNSALCSSFSNPRSE